ncbi:MAG: SLBB domain-containing protein [Candidatus Cloacimonetes bacterium]|nr:SLBB domain-containing protein [Candidatus Cloacimonadota bacterium]
MIKNKFILILFFLIFSFVLGYSFDLQNISSGADILYNISIVGAVENPGVYRILPETRLSEVFKQANLKNIQSKEAEKNVEKEPKNLLESTETIILPSNQENILKPSLRKIVLKRDSELINVDLSLFFLNGDNSNNPYLRDGDVIIVSAKNECVSISGAVNKPGIIEILPKNKLSDVIEFAYGLKPNAYLDKIEIYRKNNNNGKISYLTADFNEIINNYNSPENIEIECYDKIVVRNNPNLKEDDFINIMGEVKFPGNYIILKGKTTLLDILEISGGLLENSDLELAFIERKNPFQKVDPEFERLKEKSNEFTKVEKEYLKSSWRYDTSKIKVDFKKLWFDKDKNEDIILKKNDLIYIPDKAITVTVNGHVKNPGQFTFVPNQTISYYLDKANGFSWNVDKRRIRLIKAKTGEWTKPLDDEIVNLGDVIFIPERQEIDYWKITKEVFGVLTGIATLAVLIQNLSK